MANRIIDRDKGYKKLLKQAATMSKSNEITVGVHSDAGARNLEVGTYNEFGTQDIPSRSFIVAWADEQEAELLNLIRRVEEQVLKSGGNPTVALKRLGAVFVGKVQKRMAGGVPPPNAASTVAQKGSSKPLIDTGQLRSSIASKVNGA